MSFKTAIRQSVFDIYRLSYSFNLSYIRTRTELPLILNKRGLTGTGVEVGVWKGQFSEYILDKWKGKRLYSIDPWKNFSREEYMDVMNIKQEEFDKIYFGVQQLLSRFGKRSEILRTTSIEAASSFEDRSLDFVYLDARHHYEGVKEDIEVWYPKVRTQGVLCGHDYLDTSIGNTEFGVKRAVDDFAFVNNCNVLVTHKDQFPSWFILKTPNFLKSHGF